MLQPKKRKYRKDRKGRDRGLARCGNKVSFGEFGLKAITRARVTARQIEAARRAITKRLKKGGQIWIRIFPDKPISKKPLEVRQGSGKGNVEYWVAVVKPGSMIFEVSGISKALAMDAFAAAGNKLPVKTIFEERVIK